MAYLKSNEDDFNDHEGGFDYLKILDQNFEDLSETRKGLCWKHFWYNKEADLSKCMHCLQTFRNHGKTKLLLDHLEQAHNFEGVKPDFDVMEFVDISAKKKNEVWQHFLRSTCGEAAKCRHCHKILKTGSKASTSGIKYHLSSVHKISLQKKRKADLEQPEQSDIKTEPAELVDVKFEPENDEA